MKLAFIVYLLCKNVSEMKSCFWEKVCHHLIADGEIHRFVRVIEVSSRVTIANYNWNHKKPSSEIKIKY